LNYICNKTDGSPDAKCNTVKSEQKIQGILTTIRRRPYDTTDTAPELKPPTNFNVLMLQAHCAALDRGGPASRSQPTVLTLLAHQPGHRLVSKHRCCLKRALPYPPVGASTVIVLVHQFVSILDFIQFSKYRGCGLGLDDVSASRSRAITSRTHPCKVHGLHLTWQYCT